MEYQEFMKQFDRMCSHYRCNLDCPMGCPMKGVNISQCRKVAFENPAETEKTVSAWAVEHPEPIYPTWAEWLFDNGLVIRETASFCISRENLYGTETRLIEALTAKAEEQMPPDVCRALGIAPVNM